MTGRDLRIRSLKLRLPGEDAGAARRLARLLGEALVGQAQAGGPAPASHLKLRVRRRAGEDAGELAQRIARGLGEGGR